MTSTITPSRSRNHRQCSASPSAHTSHSTNILRHVILSSDQTRYTVEGDQLSVGARSRGVAHKTQRSNNKPPAICSRKNRLHIPTRPSTQSTHPNHQCSGQDNRRSPQNSQTRVPTLYHAKHAVHEPICRALRRIFRRMHQSTQQQQRTPNHRITTVL